MDALTPAELIKDIKSLNRIENDWLQQGRLDSLTEEDIRYKRGDLMDQLRERFVTGQNKAFGDWFAHEGDVNGPRIGYGATEIEAIEQLLGMIGDDR